MRTRSEVLVCRPSTLSPGGQQNINLPFRPVASDPRCLRGARSSAAPGQRSGSCPGADRKRWWAARDAKDRRVAPLGRGPQWRVGKCVTLIHCFPHRPPRSPAGLRRPWVEPIDQGGDHLVGSEQLHGYDVSDIHQIADALPGLRPGCCAMRCDKAGELCPVETAVAIDIPLCDDLARVQRQSCRLDRECHLAPVNSPIVVCVELVKYKAELLCSCTRDV